MATMQMRISQNNYLILFITLSRGEIYNVQHRGYKV